MVFGKAVVKKIEGESSPVSKKRQVLYCGGTPGQKKIQQGSTITTRQFLSKTDNWFSKSVKEKSV